MFFASRVLVGDLNVFVDHDTAPGHDMFLTFAIFEARISSASGHTADVCFHALGALVHPAHFDVIALAVVMWTAAPGLPATAHTGRTIVARETISDDVFLEQRAQCLG